MVPRAGRQEKGTQGTAMSSPDPARGLTAQTPSKAEVLGYVQAHENIYVQQYVEALYDEQEEIRQERDSIRRIGLSPDGRIAAIRIVRVVVVLVVGTLIFVLGRASR